MNIPDEMNEDLIEILGTICFRAAPFAGVMRANGTPIRRRAEDEQAHVIHVLLGLYAEHGSGWRSASKDWFAALAVRLKEEADAKQADAEEPE